MPPILGICKSSNTRSGGSLLIARQSLLAIAGHGDVASQRPQPHLKQTARRSVVIDNQHSVHLENLMLLS